jgi:RNA polymerase sigma-70 factor (ECF subfamily)
VSDSSENLDGTLEQYRTYLAFQIRKIVDPRLRNHLDLSGLVNQTCVEAWQALDRTRGWNDRQRAAWLDHILVRNLRDKIDKLHAGCRDVRRERSLDDAVSQSSARLANVLAAEQSSPSQRAERNEQELRLAEAVERLPDDQREALVLQRWHGWSLAQIAEHLGRSPPAVAGLLHRALKRLKEELREPE